MCIEVSVGLRFLQLGLFPKECEEEINKLLLLAGIPCNDGKAIAFRRKVRDQIYDKLSTRTKVYTVT